jgi:hypothetical protein
MTVTIDASDSRSIKALEIAAGARSWLKVRSADGELGYGIPSSCQPGRFYLVTAEACDCPDFRRFGLTGARIGQVGEHRACKHVRAVRLHEELRKAAETAKPKRRRLEIVRAASRYDQIFGNDGAAF